MEERLVDDLWPVDAGVEHVDRAGDVASGNARKSSTSSQQRISAVLL